MCWRVVENTYYTRPNMHMQASGDPRDAGAGAGSATGLGL
jgi:hypothetical protein